MSPRMTINGDSLGDIDLFRDLSLRKRSVIAKLYKPERFTKGQQIVSQDTRIKKVYFILSGSVRVAYQGNSNKEVTIYQHSDGEVFGFPSIFNGKFRSVRTEAINSVNLISTSSRNFYEVLQKHPTVSFQFNLQLVKMLCSLTERIIEFSVLDVNSRIYTELLRMITDKGNNDGTTTIYTTPTHAEIASRISTHREAVTRELKILESNGLIEREGRKLTILEPNKLKEMIAINFGELSVIDN